MKNTIYFFFYTSIFGKLIIANSSMGICYIAFCQEIGDEFNKLQATFSKAYLAEKETSIQQQALDSINKGCKENIALEIRGTEFQKEVWRAVMQIPYEKTATYKEIADSIGKPNASRAVGNAIGKNKIAILIPCHRVICTNKKIGGYKWDIDKKKKLLQFEANQALR